MFVFVQPQSFSVNMSKLPDPKNGHFYSKKKLEEILTCSDSEDDFICGSSSEDEAAELAEEFYETAVLPNHLPDAESAESENIIPNYSYNDDRKDKSTYFSVQSNC